MYLWDGSAWVRALGYAAGVQAIAPGNISVLTAVATASGTIKASAGNVYWLLCKGGSDVAEISLRDGGSGGVTKFVLKSPAGDSRFAAFNPPIRCGTDIYIVKTSGTAMEYCVGYL